MSNFREAANHALIVDFNSALFVELVVGTEPFPDTTVSITTTHENGNVSVGTFWKREVDDVFAAAKFKDFNAGALQINFEKIASVVVTRKPTTRTSVLDITFVNGTTKSIEVPTSTVPALFAN